ncbi:TPA: hypothetical protein ACH3X3_012641 [Trebouxia sp. C0006]
MAEEELTLEQFSALLTNIDSSLGPAATQLWEEEVNTEDLLRNRTKKDMYEAGINLSSRNLIFNHYHPIDADDAAKDSGVNAITANLFRKLAELQAQLDELRMQRQSCYYSGHY